MEGFPSNQDMREQVDVMESKRLSERLASLRGESEEILAKMKAGEMEVATADAEVQKRMDEAERIQTQLGRIHAQHQ